MGRHSCCYKQKLKKGLWCPEEDEKLVKHITRYGHGCWSSVPKLAGLQRCGKSCRLRWINYLRPDLKRGTFSQQEENLIVKLHAELGNRWSQIAAQMPGRTDNEIKNLWNSSIKKKLRQCGIDPDTHQQLADDQEDKTPIKDEATTESSELKIPAPTSENLNARIPELPPPALLMNTVDGYFLDSSCSENSMIQTKELFPDQFIASKESSSSCYQAPNSMAYFPLSQLSYTPDQAALATQSCNPNSNLWSKMSSRMLETNYGINCNAIFNNVSSASTSVPPTSMSSNPVIDVSPNNPGLQYWESGNSCSSSASSTNSGIELQNNNALLDDSIFSWSELGTNKETQLHLAGEPEDLKWCEYLQGALRMNSAAPNQNQASYGDIKFESQYMADGSSSWPFQSADMYGKDFQQISAAFGHI